MNKIKLTDAAITHLTSLIDKNKNHIGFRLSLKKTGCSGYSYVPNIITEINPSDIHFIAHPDLPVYLDSQWADVFKDLVIDYIEDTSLGIKQKRLVFINPNEQNRCGCGESFTLGEKPDDKK